MMTRTTLLGLFCMSSMLPLPTRGAQSAHAGKARGAAAIDDRIRGEALVHLGFCAARRPFRGGYPYEPFANASAGKDQTFVLLASITPQEIVGRVDVLAFLAMDEKPVAAPECARLPWRRVPGGDAIAFPRPRKVAEAAVQDEQGMSIEAMAGHVDLGSRGCREGRLVASTPLRAADEMLAGVEQASLWRQLMDVAGSGEPPAPGTLSARTITLGELRLRSVQVGPVWAVLDERGRLLHRQGSRPDSQGDREDTGEARWLVLPDGKRLLAVAQYKSCDAAKSTYHDGVTLLVVGPDLHVQRMSIPVSGFTGG